MNYRALIIRPRTEPPLFLRAPVWALIAVIALIVLEAMGWL